MKYQETGVTMAIEMITSATKSFDNIFHSEKIEAPNTFRTPISFVRCSATKDASPNRPRQLIKMARMAKKAESLPVRVSAANLVANSVSANL